MSPVAVNVPPSCAIATGARPNTLARIRRISPCLRIVMIPLFGRERNSCILIELSSVAGTRQIIEGTTRLGGLVFATRDCLEIGV
jgi:hypothetical protein